MDSVTTNSTETAAPAVPHLETWAAIEAAYNAASAADRAACTHRIATGHAVAATLEPKDQTNWPLVSRHPLVAPLVQAEEAAARALKAATEVLCATPAPDWRAFVVKLQVVREYADNIINPLDPRDWKHGKVKGGSGKLFRGTELCMQVELYALAAHVGLLPARALDALPRMVARVGKWAAEDDGAFEGFVSKGFASLITDAVRLASGLPTPPSPTSPPPPPTEAANDTAWRSAVATFTALKTAYDAVAEAGVAKWRAVAESAPPILVEASLHQGLGIRWLSVECLDMDPLLTPEEREELRPLMVEHKAKQEAYFRRAEGDAEDKTSESLQDAVDAAENALLRTPAPHARALALKLALKARAEDDETYGYDDLGLVAKMQEGAWHERADVLIFQDACRLGGVDHPALHVSGFEPRAWIANYEALGGFVCADNFALLLFPPPGAAGAEAAEALRRELDTPAWRYRAVYLAAEDRRCEGGDPLFDWCGGWGAQDNRGSPPAGPVLPAPEVWRVIFRERDGAPDPVVQRWVRNDGRLHRVPFHAGFQPDEDALANSRPEDRTPEAAR